MQLYVLDKNPSKAVGMLADCHIIKMCLETAQILSSVIENNHLTKSENLPKPYNQNHLEKSELEDRWKEIPIHSIETWIDLHNEIKKSKLNYRFQLNENYAVFRKSYKKLRIRLYAF